MRNLIINADDFGLSRGVNRGIIEAAEKGILTSASLMVRQPAAIEAGEYARSEGIGVGIHLDLGEWPHHLQELYDHNYVVSMWLLIDLPNVK